MRPLGKVLETIGTFGITAAARAGTDATRTATTAGASVVQRIEHLRCLTQPASITRGNAAFFAWSPTGKAPDPVHG